MAKNVVSLKLDNTSYEFRPCGTCSTALTTADKTVAISDFSLRTGATVLVKFSNGNRANNITLNVNNTGAKTVKCVGNVFNPDLYYEFRYDGANWVLIGDEKRRCAHSNANKNNYPYHRIAYTPVFTSTYSRRTIVLILNQAVFGGRYGELVIKVSSNNTNNPASYEAYWIMNKGFGADDIKIGVNNTFGDTYFDVFYKMPSAWQSIMVEQKTGAGDSNFHHLWNLCSSYETSDTTTTDKLTSIECYTTVEAAGTEIRGKAYTAIVSPNVSSGTLGKISFNGDLTGNASSATNATNVNITTSSSNVNYPLLFTTNVTAGNKGVFTDTENVLSYNPSTNLLKTRAIEVATGPLTLYTASGDSPALVFQRGTLTDDSTDWRMYVTSGRFRIQNNINNNGWVNVFEFSSPDTQTTLTSSYSITAPSFTGNLAGNASSATHLAGGAAGSIPYQTAAGTTAMLAKGTSGQVLKINSNGLPAWATDNNTTYIFGTGLESVGSSGIMVKCDDKTLFAGGYAKDSDSITDNYTGHPLQLGKDYGWINTGSNLSNLNNFVDYGIYNISGEHTRNNDNLPITNIGGGNTFQGRLLVYDSSLPNTGNAGNDCCITQVLTLSNRVGGDGNTYMRTGVGSTKSTLTWGTWGKMQTNVEVGQIPETNLANLIDNGMYSGVISYGSGSSLTTSSDPAITFVLITVNGYAAASQVGTPAPCTQLLYGISVGGTIIMKKRRGVKSGNVFSFEPWGDLGSSGGGISEIPVASATTRGGVKIDSARHPFYIIGTDIIGLHYDASLGTSAASGSDYCELRVNKASSTNIGGIKTGYTPAGKNYQVKVDNSGNAFTEIGTATADSFGVVKTTAVRTGAYSYNTGGTTSNRYYGVEMDKDGKLFVNVPWTASSTATASTTALTVTYKALSSGSATISSLTKDTITRISTSTTAALTAVTGTLTISGFATKNSNKLTTYGLQFLVGSNADGSIPKLVVPSSVKWANGIEPILTGGEIIDIVFTTTDGTNYLGTWTKYY